jgi:hypothetical protein
VRDPTWKLVTCVLAASLGEDSTEGLYRKAVASDPTHARTVLKKLGILDDLERLVR